MVTLGALGELNPSMDELQQLMLLQRIENDEGLKEELKVKTAELEGKKAELEDKKAELEDKKAKLRELTGVIMEIYNLQSTWKRLGDGTGNSGSRPKVSWIFSKLHAPSVRPSVHL